MKMRNAHACAKHSLSYKTYEVMCRLDKMKELPIGNQYCTDKAGALFCESIAKTTRLDVVRKIENCTFCSLSCDGSTDFTGEDMEAVYVRTSTSGKIEDLFLHLGSSKSASSQDIFDFLMETVKNLGLEEHTKSKLVGFCADGASNMQGMKKGVAALLKQRWPTIVVTHCLVHRLELSFKDAVKSASPKLHEKATMLLLGLYYLFRKSPKQKKGLLTTFGVLGVKQKLPVRIGGTRWLPHYMRALDIFLATYKALRYQLENSSHDNAKAEGLARIIGDGHIIAYMMAMRRVIYNLQKLSLYLQSDNISLSDAYTRVETAKISLLQLIGKTDDKLSDVLENETFEGEKLAFKGAKPTSKQTESTIRAIVSALETRFPSSKLIEATMVSSFKNWPNLTPDESKESTYGDKEVSVLYNHFCPVVFANVEVSLEDVLDEWSTLRSLVYIKYPVKTSLMWDHLISTLSDHNLENIFRLIEAVLALPPTSVKCETAFSAMKLLKTKRRGRLRNDRLNDLMTIKIMSPSIEEFDPVPAVSDWMMSTPSGQKRRVGERKTASKTTATLTQQETTEITDSDSDEMVENEINQNQVTLMSKSFEDEDDEEDDDDDDCEMSEDLVFSLLNEYRE